MRRPATVCSRAGRWPVQLRYPTGLTGEQYVSRQAWREATLERCPEHPAGGCGLRRHGSYPRVRPRGARVARWYCPKTPCTFSLLPDCLAARLCGTLVEVETAALAVEQAPSLERAADPLRPDIDLPGALRWTQRRRLRVCDALTALRGLLPEHFADCPASVSAFRARLGVEPLLPALREVAAPWLHELPAPLGLRPWVGGGGKSGRPGQHNPGPDPPAPSR